MLYMSDDKKSIEQRWPGVATLVKRILTIENVSPAEWQQMFCDVFQIVMWHEPHGSFQIKESLKEMIAEYIEQVKQRVTDAPNTEALLKSYVVEWTKFSKSADYLPLPFTPMDGKHQIHHSNPRHVQESSVLKILLETWNDIIYEKLKTRLITSAIKHIQCERIGQIVDAELFVGVVDSCARLSDVLGADKINYLEDLEQSYVEHTKLFYKPLVAEFIQENGIRAYTSYASQKLLEEEDRASRYLAKKAKPESAEVLMKACADLFVVGYLDQLLSEIPKLLREGNVELLRQFYELIRRVENGSERILVHFEQYVNQVGLEDIRQNAETMLKDANKYVERLLDLYNRFSSIVNDAFLNDPLLLASRDRAYQEIVNNTTVFTTELPTSTRSEFRRIESRCPELLASYCDLMLRKSSINKRLLPNEVEKLLDNVLLVLKYVNSKDIFVRVYKTHLIRRLLLETSADSEMEEMMVDRLRQVGMPAEQVNKLSRMFQDIKVSHDLTINFKEMYRSSGSSNQTTTVNVDMVNIFILASEIWVSKSEQKALISLPSPLEDLLPLIEKFYDGKHQGRKLIWQHHLSHGLLTFTSDRGRFDLELTAYQIVLLYAWNRRFDEKVTLDSLLTATGLQDNELRRTLWTLCEHPRMEQQVILYSPKAKSEKEFTESTQFWLNLNFANTRSGKSQARRRINLIGKLQLTQEILNEEENMAIVELRQLRAQEAIIKIMKARKTLHYNDLYSELVELLRFQFVPSKRLIKEVIEWLIEQQYLRRDVSDLNVFVYLT
ncbi:hypothetical protein CRM22_006954 [Opisthorchis felineus]|uniref:Cullin-5 n=1 Tax=Opisthorchis felineus TaxID=147828 RepID=A0A4S2LQ49_OPIFE|nr:hypothetical protein CRM22_006954 [Opisthorchis felineus]